MADGVRDKVLETVEHYKMLKSGDKVIVALSGGSDSVTLLHCLKSLEAELGITVYACHINHNLRGKDSDSDQAYVQRLCEKTATPLRAFSVDVSGTVRKHQSTEERARELRYETFGRLSEELGAKVATAHNACDNSETVLMNMLRGTGLKGLCGIPPVRDYLIRPLLWCTKEEILGYCKENGLEYVTDMTNFSTAYTRNKVRIELMPKLTEINPSLIDTIGRMTKNLTSDSEFLEGMAREALDGARLGEGVYASEKLKVLPPPIFSRGVSLMLREKGIEPTALRINGFMGIITEGIGKINIEKNKFAVVRKGKAEIQIITQNYRKKHEKNTEIS